MRHSKKLAALAIAAGVAVTATAAFAFWSADGVGSGTGTVRAQNQYQVSIEGSIADGLYPGGARDVTFTVTNENPQAVAAGTISLEAVEASDPACDVRAFTMQDIDASGESVPAALDSENPGSKVLDAKGSLEMANLSSNQDACKGATLTLTLSSTEQ